MRRRTAAATAALLVLAGCDRPAPVAGRGDTPGDRLERAARAAGLAPDPDHVDPVGLYARDGDRVCVVPAGGGRYRLGAVVAVDDGQGCAGSGEARGTGGRLAVRFADDCRFEATLDGDRLTLPATLPAGCDRFCTGRATLTALSVERLSGAAAEAAALRDGRGRALCDAGEGGR